MTARTAAQIVVQCENVLGWTPNPKVPLGTARRIAATKLKAEIEKDPKRLTYRNLELAIELCRRQRQQIKSPLYLIHKVDEAAAAANPVQQRTDITTLVEAALRVEMDAPATERGDHWIGRLMRSRGDFRHQTYAEWVAERRMEQVA